MRPTSSRATSFSAFPLQSYPSFFDDIFTKTVSIDAQNATAFTDESGSWFAFQSPNDGAEIANTQTTVVGLPYFTTYGSFTDAVISFKNHTYVTATIANDISNASTDYDGIWQGNNPDLQPVAIISNAAPDGKNSTFSSFAAKAGPSRNGKLVAFMATTSLGTNGVFRANSDGTGKILVTKVGATAPTTSAVGNLGSFSSFTLVGCNDAGRSPFWRKPMAKMASGSRTPMAPI